MTDVTLRDLAVCCLAIIAASHLTQMVDHWYRFFRSRRPPMLFMPDPVQEVKFRERERMADELNHVLLDYLKRQMSGEEWKP